MTTQRSSRVHGLFAAVLMLAACASQTQFPGEIRFGAGVLTRSARWARGGVSGAVYVVPGERMPEAALQVGAIVSTEHTTAEALHRWISSEYLQSGVSPMYDSNTVGESCKVGIAPVDGGTRTFISLQVCKTGVSRAACVEADEKLDVETFTTCVNRVGCFEGVCDQRWLERREALDTFIADTLSRR